jgi:hypothetical protein
MKLHNARIGIEHEERVNRAERQEREEIYRTKRQHATERTTLRVFNHDLLKTRLDRDTEALHRQ